MDKVIDWLDARPTNQRVLSLVGLVIVAAAVVSTVSVFAAPASPVAGCFAGIALFIAGFGWWHSVLSPQARESTDLKAILDLRPRRGAVGAALAVWIIALLLAGPYVPSALMGTLNVFVAVSLYWVWRATPAEAVEAAARWEIAQAAKEAEREAAQADLVDDDTL